MTKTDIIKELKEALETCKYEDTMTGARFWFDFDKVEQALAKLEAWEATATPDKQVDDLVELVRDAIAANDCRFIDSANAVLEVLRPYLKEQTTNQRNALTREPVDAQKSANMRDKAVCHSNLQGNDAGDLIKDLQSCELIHRGGAYVQVPPSLLAKTIETISAMPPVKAGEA
jgi:hypothetical protein